VRRRHDEMESPMLASQMALNYGLFRDRIVYRGDHDAPDRRFLRDMAENTAREIYEKKVPRVERVSSERSDGASGRTAGAGAVGSLGKAGARVLQPISRFHIHARNFVACVHQEDLRERSYGRPHTGEGRKMRDVMIQHLVAFVEDLKRLTLDEIHHRRF
jgi:hypothetical protein